MKESNKYLTEQIITYLGNKRALLDFICVPLNTVQKELKKKKLKIADLFSGSGITSRFFKRYSSELYVNDLEDYAETLSKCYLTNKSDFDKNKLERYYKKAMSKLDYENLDHGFITNLYCPRSDKNIRKGERVFFKRRNGMYIDTARQIIGKYPEPYKTLLLGPLLYEASTKNNTSGVFKGFYKNSSTDLGQFGGNGRDALKRILSDIKLKKPVLSNFKTKVFVYKGDTNKIIKKMPPVDLAYLDPPYNQHPYSSNYFMLNLINNYEKPKQISKISGIPTNWNKSNYNKRTNALKSLNELCGLIKAKYVLISYNSEGFISKGTMLRMLKKHGSVRTFKSVYNVYRGCRNLKNRNIHLNEFLFLLKKI